MEKTLKNHGQTDIICETVDLGIYSKELGWEKK